MAASQAPVGGRYEITGELGRGGVGVVWRARDLVLQREVALKEVRLPPTLSDRERHEVRERLLREARAAARLTSPSVTTVYDIVLDGDTAHLVMELVQAPSLRDLVARLGPLSPQRAARIGLDVLEALRVAHAAGIVHRDVKPGNVMVPDSGPAKLADFGIAAVTDDATLTRTGLVLGSPSYMAPEQAGGGRSGPAVDLWGLGATLYYAVEGTPPFDRGQPLATLTAVVHDPLPQPRRAGALRPAIEALLEKDPQRRADEDGARRLLLEAAQPAPGAAAPAPPPGPDRRAGTAPLAARTAPAPAAPDDLGPPERSRRGPGWWPVVVVGMLAVAALAVLGLTRMTAGPPAPAERAAGQDAGGREQRADQGGDARQGQGGGQGQGAAEDAGQGSGGGQQRQDAGSAAPSVAAGDAPAAPPDGWTTHDIADTGASVAYPQGWQVAPRTATATDLRDPDSGTYLRVDYTDSPGDDPVAAWEALERSFAARHSGYRRVRIEPLEYRDYDAALWEYTYEASGRQLHAYNLGFVTGGRGYALNFQTREEDWAESQDLFETFTATFRPGA